VVILNIIAGMVLAHNIWVKIVIHVKLIVEFALGVGMVPVMVKRHQWIALQTAGPNLVAAMVSVMDKRHRWNAL
jgi:hypothetical protein